MENGKNTDVTNGFIRDFQARERKLTGNIRTERSSQVRFSFIDLFGFAEHQEDATYL